jgi:hypothetical protein
MQTRSTFKFALRANRGAFRTGHFTLIGKSRISTGDKIPER